MSATTRAVFPGLVEPSTTVWASFLAFSVRQGTETFGHRSVQTALGAGCSRSCDPGWSSLTALGDAAERYPTPAVKALLTDVALATLGSTRQNASRWTNFDYLERRPR